MDELDESIEEVRGIVDDAWEDGDWVTWVAASCVLLGWRIARALRG